MERVLMEWLGASSAWAATAAAWEAAARRRNPAASSEIRSRWASAGETWATAASSWSPGASSTWAPRDASWRQASVSWAKAARLWAFAGQSWAVSAQWFPESAHQAWFWANTATEWGYEAMRWATAPRDWDSSTLRWADVAGMHSLAGEESAKLAALSGVTAATGPYQFPPPLNADERPEEANGAGPGQFPPPMDSSLILPQRSDDVVASSSGLPLPMLSDSGRQGKATKSEESTEVEDVKAATSAAPGPGQSLPPMDSSLILPHRSNDVVASSSALPLPMLSNSGEQEKVVKSEKYTEMEEEAEKVEATADGAARDKGKEMAGVAAAGSRARAPVTARKEETPALPDLNDMQAFPEIPAPVPGRSRPPKPGHQSRHSSA